MFRIIGSDQRLYGPVSAETIRQWMAEGRVNASTVVQPEGSAEWKRLSEFAEFASASPPPQQQPPMPQPAPQYVLQPNYGNGMATAGFVFGLLSMCCCCSLLFGAAGLVLSIIALNRAKELPNGEGKNLATAGMILSIIGLVEGVSLPFVSLLFHPNHFGFHMY
jgi:hypothetical protein